MEETSSKLLWYTKSDKVVRCYNLLPIARINQVINRTVGHNVNKIQFFIIFF